MTLHLSRGKKGKRLPKSARLEVEWKRESDGPFPEAGTDGIARRDKTSQSEVFVGKTIVVITGLLPGTRFRTRLGLWGFGFWGQYGGESVFATTRETVVDDANGSSSQPKCANETTETKQNGSAPSRPTPVSSKETAFAAVAAAYEAERVAAETKRLELFAAMTPGEQNACAAAEKKRAEAAVAVAKAEKTRAASVAKAKKERAEASVEKAKAKKERAASAAKATRGRAESAAAAAKAEKERAEAAVAAAKAEKERAASTAKTEKEAQRTINAHIGKKLRLVTLTQGTWTGETKRQSRIFHNLFPRSPMGVAVAVGVSVVVGVGVALVVVTKRLIFKANTAF